MNISTLKTQILKPKVIIVIWLVSALVCAILKWNINEYNNFSIFTGVAHHLFNGLPLYEFYPNEYFDRNHYGPLFGFVIAPFAYLPSWLAIPLWLVCLTALLCWAVNKLPIEDKWKSIILILSLNDLIFACMMQQFNIGIAAILIGSYVLIERKHYSLAALVIVIGTFTKLYGIVGLSMFFFVKNKPRFILYFALWSVVALLLPLLFVSPEYLICQYRDWFETLSSKNGLNIFTLHQNVSLLGVVRKISGNPNYSDLWIIAPAMIMFLCSYLRWDCFKDTRFRMLLISSAMIFVVLFSTGSENSGYIIASIGASIWWVTLKKRGVFEWVLLALLLISTFAGNLFTREFYQEVFFKYALRAIPMTLVWLYIMYELYFEKFNTSPQSKNR